MHHVKFAAAGAPPLFDDREAQAAIRRVLVRERTRRRVPLRRSDRQRTRGHRGDRVDEVDLDRALHPQRASAVVQLRVARRDDEREHDMINPRRRHRGQSRWVPDDPPVPRPPTPDRPDTARSRRDARPDSGGPPGYSRRQGHAGIRALGGPPFSQAIATPAEHASRRWTTALELISLWPSEEALSKALGDALDYDPGRLEPPAGRSDGACRRRLWLVAHGHPAGARRLLRVGVLARAFPEVITPLPDRHT